MVCEEATSRDDASCVGGNISQSEAEQRAKGVISRNRSIGCDLDSCQQTVPSYGRFESFEVERMLDE